MDLKYPDYFSIRITNRCLLRCKQCGQWKNKDSENELSTGDKIELLKQIKDLIIKKRIKSPYIYFSGGEPFLKKEEVLKLANFCKENNLICGVSSNCYLIDEKLAKEIADSKMSVYASLDSMNPDIYNELRGKNDCHKRILAAIDYLIKYAGNEKVGIASILMKKNLSEIKALINFSREKDIWMLFQPFMYNYFQAENPEYLKNEYLPDNEEEIDKAIETIDNMRSKAKIIISKLVLSACKDYFLKNKISVKCNFDKNIIIDCEGNVALCFNSEPIGNIKKDSLENILVSKKARIMRTKLRGCNKACSLLVCQNRS